MKKLIVFLFLFFYIPIFCVQDIQKKTINIGFVFYDESDILIKLIRDEIEKQIKLVQEAVIVPKYAFSQRDQVLQEQQVNALISQKVDILAINLVDASGSDSIMKKANKFDIPVIFFNRQPTDININNFRNIYYIGSEVEKSAQNQAKILENYWKKNNITLDLNKDKILQYVIITDKKDSQETSLRTNSIKDYFKNQNTSVELIAQESASGKRTEAESLMENLIKTYNGVIEAVICNNDEMASGVLDALINSVNFDTKRIIPVIGVDIVNLFKTKIVEKTIDSYTTNDIERVSRDILRLSLDIKLHIDPKLNIDNIKGKFNKIPYKDDNIYY